MVVRVLPRRRAAADRHAPVAELAGQWSAAWAGDFYQQQGRLPAPATRRQSVFAMERMLDALAVRDDATEWWRNQVWDLLLDSRIPRRAHEPCGTHRARFDRFTVGWLRDAAQYYLAMQMQAGNLSWTSGIQQLTLLRRLDVFLLARGGSYPALAEGFRAACTGRGPGGVPARLAAAGSGARPRSGRVAARLPDHRPHPGGRRPVLRVHV